MTPLLLRPEARADIEEARAWYEGQRPGLGKKFLVAARETLAEIEDLPRRFPRVRGEIRRAPLKVFPWAIFFIPEENQIVVIACFHARRDPKIWQTRR